MSTHNALDLAKDRGARFMLASTSEVYGDSLVHPQHEEYRERQPGRRPRRLRRGQALREGRYRCLPPPLWGRDEDARIFNTYGPRMRPDDGRLIPNFVSQALSGEPLTVYGDGTQTRSLQYVDDLVEGVRRLMRSPEMHPVNFRNPVEYTVREVADLILELSGSASKLVHEPLSQDDPRQRHSDTTRPREVLGWESPESAPGKVEAHLAWFAGRLRAH